MASISSLAFWRHLRAEPNQYILHYRNGRIVRKGPGLAYWFAPLSASIAQLPVEDCETTFLLSERSSDLQELAAQCTIRYRIADPERAASRLNWTISIESGRWVEEPLERIATFWAQRAQRPARAYLTQVPVVEAIRSGAEAVREAIETALLADPEVAAMGLALVSVQVVRIAPTAELEKAMQTPTRESIQQKADEAVFSRRAQAVEKERAIKENELATQIELARRQEELIRQEGANRLRDVELKSQVERAAAVSAAEKQAIEAEAYAKEVQTKAAGDAGAERLVAEAGVESERQRMEIYQTLRTPVLVTLALRELGGKIENIQHLNITPDLVGRAIEQLLRDKGGNA